MFPRTVLSLVVCAGLVKSFYLPGIAPVTYCSKEEEEASGHACKSSVDVFVNRLNSKGTVVPYEYDKFDLCATPVDVDSPALNLGQVLFGDRIRPSPIKLEFLKEEGCREVCNKTYTPGVKDAAVKLGLLKKIISYNYQQNWIVDNMPVTWCYKVQGTKKEYCTSSFPLGCFVNKDGLKRDTCIIHVEMNEKNTFYIYNHAELKVRYHKNDDSQDTSSTAARIVSIRIEPKSIKYHDRCGRGFGPMAIPGDLPLKHELLIRYTYSVTWEEDKEQKWASRWDYILEAMPHTNIIWFSYINSFIVILFLTAILLGVVLKSLRNDITVSNEMKDSEDSLGKYDKWRLLHGDVYRPPRHGMFLSALAGNGVQIIFMVIITLQFAAFGMLSPANRGALGTCALIVFVLAGFPSGVASARVYKKFGGEFWKTNAITTALLFPGLMFGMYMVLNIILWSLGSSAAIPVTTLLALIGLWLGASLALTFVGAFLGQRKGEKFPSVPFTEKPRSIPARSIVYKTIPGMIIGGVLPFGCIFIQSFFVLNSIWSHQVYYTYGLLLLGFVLLIVTCSEATILLCYFHLNAQDYHWWWRSYLSSGFTAVYFFIYSINYFVRKTDIYDHGGISTALYFCYMLMISFGLFLFTGTVGFFACFWFVKRIYNAVK